MQAKYPLTHPRPAVRTTHTMPGTGTLHQEEVSGASADLPGPLVLELVVVPEGHPRTSHAAKVTICGTRHSGGGAAVTAVHTHFGVTDPSVWGGIAAAVWSAVNGNAVQEWLDGTLDELGWPPGPFQLPLNAVCVVPAAVGWVPHAAMVC
jgi:hypothetical protein